jgi:streptogramin lyase
MTGITEFPLPAAASGPYMITAGPDGALWFTEDVSAHPRDRLRGWGGRTRTAESVGTKILWRRTWNSVPRLRLWTIKR